MNQCAKYCIYRLLYIVFFLLLASTSSAISHKPLLNSNAQLHGFKAPTGEEINASTFVAKLLCIFVLVLFGGLVAGLTLGLMSLDETNLHILSNSGDQKQRKYANRIKPIRKNGHLLLVTLLLTNTLINETMPILIDGIFGGGLAAVLISTALILVFGEIIPQAVCARYGLRIGAFFAWPVRILIYFLFVISYPVAKLLDFALGQNHGITYRRPELKELVAFHEAGKGGNLSRDEVTIIRGALDLSEKSSLDIMTELKYVFMVEIDCLLDSITLRDIIRAGHSRIPVYDKTRDNVVGLLIAKTLILVDPNASTPVRDIKLFKLPKADESKSVFDLLNMFQEGSSHMCLIVDKQKVPVGIVTLEDVLEELIQEEIVDETDVFIDVSNRIKVVRRGASIKSSPLLKSKAAFSSKGERELANKMYENLKSSKKRKIKKLISYEDQEHPLSNNAETSPLINPTHSENRTNKNRLLEMTKMVRSRSDLGNKPKGMHASSSNRGSRYRYYSFDTPTKNDKKSKNRRPGTQLDQDQEDLERLAIRSVPVSSSSSQGNGSLN